MAEDLKPNDELDKRLSELQQGSQRPGKPVNRFALAGVTGAVMLAAGFSLSGVFRNDGDQQGTAPQTAASSEFQRENPNDFTTKPEEVRPQVPERIVRDEAKEQELAEEVARLRAELTAARAALDAAGNAPEDTSALAELRAQVESFEARLTEASEARQAAEDRNAALELELTTLRTELESSQISEEEAAERARREAELETARQTAEALRVARINSPITAFRLGGGGEGEVVTTEAGGGSNGEQAAEDGRSADERFVRRKAERSEADVAEVIAAPANTIVQGTIIQGTLDGALNTGHEGNITATVSYDVWSVDLSQVLVPRGSRMFGRYSAEASLGQKRVLIAWDRVITPDNHSLRLTAYGTDGIGRSGLPAKVKTHLLQKISGAALVSIISATPTLLAASAADDSQNITVGDDEVNPIMQAGVAASSAIGEAAASALEDYLTIAPTLAVDQGMVVNVVVDRDIEVF